MSEPPEMDGPPGVRGPPAAKNGSSAEPAPSLTTPIPLAVSEAEEIIPLADLVGSNVSEQARKELLAIPRETQLQVQQQIIALSYRHTGPLPDARLLAQYEKVLPGLAMTIVKEFQAEAAHRRALDNRSQDMDQSALHEHHRLSRLGMIFAFILSLAGFVLVAYVAALGHPATASTLGTVMLGGLVGVFIYGRKKQAEENKLDAEALAGENQQSPMATPAANSDPRPQQPRSPNPKILGSKSSKKRRG